MGLCRPNRASSVLRRRTLGDFLSQYMATSRLAPRGGRESAFRAGRQPSSHRAHTAPTAAGRPPASRSSTAVATTCGDFEGSLVISYRYETTRASRRPGERVSGGPPAVVTARRRLLVGPLRADLRPPSPRRAATLRALSSSLTAMRRLAPRGGRESAFRAGRQPSSHRPPYPFTAALPPSPRQIIIMSETVARISRRLGWAATAVSAATIALALSTPCVSGEYGTAAETAAETAGAATPRPPPPPSPAPRPGPPPGGPPRVSDSAASTVVPPRATPKTLPTRHRQCHLPNPPQPSDASPTP